MSKKFGIISIATSCAALIVAVVMMIVVIVKLNNNQVNNNNAGEDVQYVLYLGTNDKDTNEPVFTHEKAKEELIKILIDHFGGYTISEANGGWIDGDITYTEYTLVIYLSDTTLDEVHSAAKVMINVFHQSSILIQANKTSTEFYGG